MWGTLAGAAIAVVVAVVAVTSSGGGDAAGPGGALATPEDTVTAEVTEAPVPEELSPSPSRSPSPTPSPRPAVRPADLLAGLRSTVDGLVRDRQLRRDAGNELGKRLRAVGAELADGDQTGAREELREFAERLVDLRDEERISRSGYDRLAAATQKLAQALTSR